MSGLLRNLLTFVVGLLAYGRQTAADSVVTGFWVTPFDSGIRILKSDKYFQFAEAAQVDYLLKTGKLFELLRGGASFVNLAQAVKFSRPITVFSRVRVETRLIFADEKCAYFSHAMSAKGEQAAEVLVKMKFKRDRITVPPSDFLPMSFQAIPEKVRCWELTLQRMGA